MVVYLARSGGRVEIPNAVEMRARDDSGIIDFLDKDGVVLVSFQRPDLLIIDREGKLEPDLPRP